jgi:hypothetical protein
VSTWAEDPVQWIHDAKAWWEGLSEPQRRAAMAAADSSHPADAYSRYLKAQGHAGFVAAQRSWGLGADSAPGRLNLCMPGSPLRAHLPGG